MQISRNPAHGSADMHGETVLLNSDTGEFFKLEGVAKAIWTRIESGCDLDRICAFVEREYDVAVGACEADVMAFCRHLERLGFVAID